MDFMELNNILQELGFDKSEYSLNAGPKEEAVTIEWYQNKWVIYSTSRGSKTYYQYFNDFNDACKYLFDMFISWSQLYNFKTKSELEEIKINTKFFNFIRCLTLNNIEVNKNYQNFNIILDLKPTFDKIEILKKESNFEGVLDYVNENQLLPKKDKDYYKAIPVISPIINDETISYYLVWGKEDEVYLTTDNFESFIKVFL